jgi:uncharacterized membrane protein YccC
MLIAILAVLIVGFSSLILSMFVCTALVRAPLAALLAELSNGVEGIFNRLDDTLVILNAIEKVSIEQRDKV